MNHSEFRRRQVGLPLHAVAVTAYLGAGMWWDHRQHPAPTGATPLTLTLTGTSLAASGAGYGPAAVVKSAQRDG
jgi:hypothetical protein